MKQYSTRISLSIFILLVITTVVLGQTKNTAIYQLRIYHYHDPAQEKNLDNYLEHAFVPAMHRQGITEAGVFKWLGNDTAQDKRLFVFLPYKNMKQSIEMQKKLNQDVSYLQQGAPFLNASYDHPPYDRMETILLKAFSQMPKMKKPDLKNKLSERVYELRSYESATEQYHENKVQMFNEGGEVKLFKNLNFNAVFYAKVLVGGQMPNLMYMTTFENQADRDAHWKAFSADPVWKTLSANEKYQHNVSHISMWFLRPTNYSDI